MARPRRIVGKWLVAAPSHIFTREIQRNNLRNKASHSTALKKIQAFSVLLFLCGRCAGHELKATKEE